MIQGTIAYMRPPKLLALLQAHDIARYRDSDRVGHSFGKPALWLEDYIFGFQGSLSPESLPSI